MPHRCTLGCKSTDVPLHIFPNPNKFPNRFKTWVNLVGGKLEAPSDYEFYKKQRLCDIHFTIEQKNRFKRLNALAVPSLHLPDVSMHGFPDAVKFPERFKTWVNLVDSKPKTSPDLKSFKNKRICDIHFIDSHKNRNNRLNALAVPMLYLPDKLSNVLTQSERASSRSQSEHSPGQPEVSDNLQSTSGGNYLDEHNYTLCQEEDESSTEPITVTIGEEEAASHQVTDQQDDFTEMDTSLDQSIQACRVCLALDVKMYDLKDTELGTMFQNITGIVITESSHSILEHVCWECAARLKAAAEFRHKALLSDALLHGLVNTGDQIQKSDITLLREKEEYLNSVRVLTSQEVFHIVDIENETERDLCISHNNDREIVNNTEDLFEPDDTVNGEIEEELDNTEYLFVPNNIVNQVITEKLDNNRENLFEPNNIVNQEIRVELKNNTEYLFEPDNSVNQEIREEYYEMQIVDEESMMVVPVNTEIEFDSINLNNEDANIMFLELNSELTEVVSENTKEAVNVEYTYTRGTNMKNKKGGIRKKVSTRGKNAVKKTLMLIKKDSFG